ncbi:MAG TPA: T9SS type A sorting domain-containing protein, partial [Candidatus Kapabacteria bacterium]|nr:T9SS type A sorting domain-containing protein [Candidatus Kapabacteria bacterium]
INGSWGAFTPGSGNPAYGHLAYQNGSPIGGYGTFSRGFWIPMLRPFFGLKRTVSQIRFAPECLMPVELTFFDGQARANSVDLFWQTASEERNAGFQVERRLKLEDVSVVQWEKLAFIPGAGNSSTVRDYNFTDADVVAGATYQYRLMQYDIDGGEDCKQVADILEFPIGANELIVNVSNVPNPVIDKTTIQFNLTENANVKVTVQDIQGNVVATLMNNQELNAGFHTLSWSAGNEIASGIYIYRIEANGTVVTGTISVVH